MTSLRRKSAYKTQLWLQIILPVALAFLLAILAAAAIAQGGAAHTSQWASLSLIWMILPLLLLLLVFLVVLGAMIYGLARLLDILPRYTRLAQNYADILAAKTRRFADKAAAPVFFVEKTRAEARALLKLSSSKKDV